MSTTKLCTLLSSCGEVTFRLDTGIVLKVLEYDDGDEPSVLPDIYRVDVDRMREMFPELDHEEMDILNVGYWYVTPRGSTAYEPPEPNHAAWAAGKREFPW